MDDNARNLIIASILLILASMYGGDTLGTWFAMKTEVSGDGDIEFEGVDKYYLTDYSSELEWSGSDAPDNEEYTNDYEDNGCSLDGKCKEMSSLMVDKIQYLLYLVIISGFAALYFLNENDVEKGKMACLTMGGAGLLAVIMFTFLFPEALDDDGEIWKNLDDIGMSSEPSIFGSDTTTENGVSIKISWRPDFAFLLVAISSILGIAAYGRIDSEASSNLSNQSEYQENPFSTPSMPSIPTLEGTPETPNPYQVQCGNCQMMMDGNVEHCPNCGFQNR